MKNFIPKKKILLHTLIPILIFIIVSTISFLVYFINEKIIYSYTTKANENGYNNSTDKYIHDFSEVNIDGTNYYLINSSNVFFAGKSNSETYLINSNVKIYPFAKKGYVKTFEKASNYIEYNGTKLPYYDTYSIVSTKCYIFFFYFSLLFLIFGGILSVIVSISILLYYIIKNHKIKQQKQI